MEDTAYTYILECRDGTLYTGWTKHLKKRMRCHNAGKGAKYTRSRLPVRLVYFEKVVSRQEAMKREYVIKQLTRRDKLQLIKKRSLQLWEDCEQINRNVLHNPSDTL